MDLFPLIVKDTFGYGSHEAWINTEKIVGIQPTNDKEISFLLLEGHESLRVCMSVGDLREALS